METERELIGEPTASQSSSAEVGERPVALPSEWNEWVRLHANRDEMARAYAVELTRRDLSWRGFTELNAAILRRWSPAGLRYIEQKAWKLASLGVGRSLPKQEGSGNG